MFLPLMVGHSEQARKLTDAPEKGSILGEHPRRNFPAMPKKKKTLNINTQELLFHRRHDQTDK